MITHFSSKTLSPIYFQKKKTCYNINNKNVWLIKRLNLWLSHNLRKNYNSSRRILRGKNISWTRFGNKISFSITWKDRLGNNLSWFFVDKIFCYEKISWYLSWSSYNLAGNIQKVHKQYWNPRIQRFSKITPL